MSNFQIFITSSSPSQHCCFQWLLTVYSYVWDCPASCTLTCWTCSHRPTQVCPGSWGWHSFLLLCQLHCSACATCRLAEGPQHLTLYDTDEEFEEHQSQDRALRIPHIIDPHLDIEPLTTTFCLCPSSLITNLPSLMVRSP